MTTVTGTICGLKREGNNFNGRQIFTIKESNGEMHQVSDNHKQFLPIWDDDIISTEITNGKISTFPFVVIPDEGKQIDLCIKKSSYGLFRGKGKEQSLAYDFELSRQKYNPGLCIGKYLDTIASNLYYVDNYDNENINLPDTDILKEDKLKVFFRRWLKNRLFRQLYLLSFNKKDINAMARPGKYNLTEIFSVAIDNPYQIVSIPIEVCDNIVMSTQGEINPLHRFGGECLRMIDEKQRLNSWTYVPESHLAKKYPSYVNHKEMLSSEFDLFFDEDRIYSHYSYKVETEVAKFINKLLETPIIQIDEEMLDFPDFLSQNQKDAIIFSLMNPVSIIMGPPGTGKSTILGEVAKFLEEIDELFYLCAFTGNAANRISECVLKCVENKKLIHDRICTLDKLIIRYTNESSINKPPVKNLVIDEIGMVTTELLYRTFQAAGKKIRRLSFFGDNEQLNPISWGYFLNSAIKTNIPTFYLTECFRSSSVDKTQLHPIVLNSRILVNSAKAGQVPAFIKSVEFKTFDGDIFKVEQALKKFNADGITMNNFRILSPVNRDLPLLNKVVHNIFLPNADEVKDKWGKVWVMGSIVMVTQNFYGQEYQLANGEEGIIIDMGFDNMDDDKDYEYVEVEFKDDKKVKFFMSDAEELNNQRKTSILAPSSAKTIHKSQGSEYDCVIVYFPTVNLGNSKSSFFNYKLINTAITRAKKLAWIIGDISCFKNACMKLPYFVYENLARRLPQKEIEVVDEEPECEYVDDDDIEEYYYD